MNVEEDGVQALHLYANSVAQLASHDHPARERCKSTKNPRLYMHLASLA